MVHRLYFLIGVFCICLLGGQALAETLAVLSDRQLPEPIVWASDLRWNGPDSLWIAAGKDGVFSVDPAAADLSPKLLLSTTGNPKAPMSGQLWGAHRLALSPSYVVVAAPAFAYGWLRRPRQHSLHLESVMAILELDVLGDRFLLLGGMQDTKGRLSPDGAIGWLGAVEDGADALRPVLYSRAGPGAKTLNDCAILSPGGARFLADGSFVMVPGVDPGVYWYDAEGQLLRTWENAAVGLDEVCEGVPEGMMRSLELQFTWRAGRRVLEAILPLPAGPALVIRQPGIPSRWKLHKLRRDGKGTTQDLPFRSGAAQARLRADVQGQRVAWLLVEMAAPRPPVPARLLLTGLP